MAKNNLKLSKEEVCSLLYEESVFDEKDNEIFEFIDKKFEYADSEKSSVKYKVTIKEVSTGKYWQTTLGESPWYLQDEHNADQIWTEVKKKTKTVENYE